MSQEPSKTPDQAQKKLEEITEEDIKQAAIARAEQIGWKVGLDDCQVQKVIPPPQVIDEIGLGTTTTKPPITKCLVHITPKAPQTNLLRT